MGDAELESLLRKAYGEPSPEPTASTPPKKASQAIPEDQIQKDLEEEFAKVSVADTGSTQSSAQESQQVADLSLRLAQLSHLLQEQRAVMNDQAQEIRTLRESNSAPPIPLPSAIAPAAPRPAAPMSEDEGAASSKDGPSFEAAKQRLRRKVRAGTLPENVLSEWNKQGKARTALINMFLEAQCDEAFIVLKLNFGPELIITFEGP